MILLRALAVAAGGVLGTAARLALDLAIPDPGGFPLAILLVNITGAFLIGIVMARMPRATGLRLFLATGLLGGFTTYSAFGVGTIQLWESAPGLAALYAVASLVLGVTAAALGLRAGEARRREGG